MKKVMILMLMTLCVAGVRAQDHDHDHGSMAKHGGKVMVVGDHVAHVELVHDVKHGKIMLYTLNNEGKEVGIGDAPTLNLMVSANGKTSKLQIVAKALNLKDGKAHSFEAEDPIFKTENFAGRISLKINGQSYLVALEHGHGHGHDDHDDHHDHDDHDHHDHEGSH